MLARTLDFIFPPQCLICRHRVDANGTLCLGCWKNMHFITEPYCECCGLPFDFDLGKNVLCGDCIQKRPHYSRARAAFKYDDASSKLVTALKYNDQLHLAATYGAWLAKAGGEIIAASDAIVPVPLHWKRFASRRYNQAALLAFALEKQVRLPVFPDALKRIKPTQPQTGLTRSEREKNVRGAFAINAKYLEAVRGKSLLLIDDVMTTSATLQRCTHVLLENGATTVNVLTLARRI